MQPQNPYQPEPSGIDYLNQIAPPQKPAGFDKKTKIILIIFGIIGLLSVGLIALTATNQPSNSASPLKLAARLQKLQTIATKYNKKLNDSDLQGANSALIAVLTTANSSIAQPLAANKIDLKKSAKEIPKLDPSAKIEEYLDDKFLESGGQLDQYYAAEMNAQLTDTQLMMQKLLRSTKSKSMKEFLEKNLSDLKNIQKQFEDYGKSSAN